MPELTAMQNVFPTPDLTSIEKGLEPKHYFLLPRLEEPKFLEITDQA